MRPIDIPTSVRISASPEEVWPYLVDWERLDRWMVEASDFRVLTAHREGVGVQAEATISIGGIKTRDRIEVSRWEPPRLLEIVHLGWVEGTGLMVLFESGAGTRLDWTERLATPWGPVGALGIRLFRPLMRRIFQRDLYLLKELVEREKRK